MPIDDTPVFAAGWRKVRETALRSSRLPDTPPCARTMLSIQPQVLFPRDPVRGHGVGRRSREQVTIDQHRGDRHSPALLPAWTARLRPLSTPEPKPTPTPFYASAWAWDQAVREAGASIAKSDTGECTLTIPEWLQQHDPARAERLRSDAQHWLAEACKDYLTEAEGIAALRAM